MMLVSNDLEWRFEGESVAMLFLCVLIGVFARFATMKNGSGKGKMPAAAVQEGGLEHFSDQHLVRDGRVPQAVDQDLVLKV